MKHWDLWCYKKLSIGVSCEREETVKRRNRYTSYRVVQEQGDAKNAVDFNLLEWIRIGFCRQSTQHIIQIAKVCFIYTSKTLTSVLFYIYNDDVWMKWSSNRLRVVNPQADGLLEVVIWWGGGSPPLFFFLITAPNQF